MIHTALCKWSVLSKDWSQTGKIGFDPSYYTVHAEPTPLDKCVDFVAWSEGSDLQPPPDTIFCRISRWVDAHKLLAGAALVLGLIAVRSMGGDHGRRS